MLREAGSTPGLGSQGTEGEAIEGWDVGAIDGKEDVIAILDTQDQDSIQLPILQSNP